MMFLSIEVYTMACRKGTSGAAITSGFRDWLKWTAGRAKAVSGKLGEAPQSE